MLFLFSERGLPYQTFDHPQNLRHNAKNRMGVQRNRKFSASNFVFNLL